MKYRIVDIHPIDVYYSIRSRYIGKVVSVSKMELTRNHEDYNTVYGKIDGKNIGFYAVKVLKITDAEMNPIDYVD
jgi:hypothetical protein